MSMEDIDQIIGEELGLRKKRNSIIEDLVSEEIRKIQKACKYSCSQKYTLVYFTKKYRLALNCAESLGIIG